MSLENHLLGMRAEQLFDERCSEYGIESVKPVSMFTACDRMVRVGERWLVVQIKACRSLAKLKKGKGRGWRWVYHADNRRANKVETPFRDAGVDVMVVYVEPLNRWHLFPATCYKGQRIYIARNPVGQMKKWIENWDLLRDGVAGSFLKPKQVQLVLSIL